MAVAGFFGGPVVALIAAMICAAYRISMGGAGVGIGVAVIAASSAIGVGFFYLRRGDHRFHRWTALWGFGFLVHLVMVFLLWFVPAVGRK